MGDAPAPEHPRASTECLEIAPNVASKSETMTMATLYAIHTNYIHFADAYSSIATAENLIRVNSLNENTREEPYVTLSLVKRRHPHRDVVLLVV